MKKLFLQILVFVFAISLMQSVAAAPSKGAIWTTFEECGDIKQDANHYSIGDTVYVNGENFEEGEHPWSITGKPGHASSDPGQVVAFGIVDVDDTGSFCFEAYVIEPGDDGEYGVSVDKKSDNYRVEGASLTCEEAIEEGLLTAEIDGGMVHVSNMASKKYDISFVSYQIYSGNVFDQTPFDWKSINLNGGKEKTIKIELPTCAYQLDLVCGDPLLENPEYEDRVIATEFQNLNDYCTHEDSSSGKDVSATISVDGGFPQGNDYVFHCAAEGFTPTSYSWYYGDGALQVNTLMDNTFYSYSPGDYTVACRATDGTDWAVDTMEIEVQ